MRVFECKNGLGLLGGKLATIEYNKDMNKWYVTINGTQMGYTNLNEALKDLKCANFVEKPISLNSIS